MPPVYSCHLRIVTSTYSASSSRSRPCRFVFSQAMRVEPEPPKTSKTRSPRPAAVLDRPLDQFDRLHGRMQSIDTRLIATPHIPLIPIPAPMPGATLLPTVQQRFVLPLVVGASQGERIFRPDHEG